MEKINFLNEISHFHQIEEKSQANNNIVSCSFDDQTLLLRENIQKANSDVRFEAKREMNVKGPKNNFLHDNKDI